MTPTRPSRLCSQPSPPCWRRPWRAVATPVPCGARERRPPPSARPALAELPPASTAALDYGEVDTESVTGVTAPGYYIHKVDPSPCSEPRSAATRTSTAPSTPRTVRRPSSSKITGKDTLGGKCPILQAYYRDLTGDRKDDLVLGIRFPQNQLAVRVYTFEHHKLVQIMGTADSTISVEVAGRDVIIRSPSTLPGDQAPHGVDLGPAPARDAGDSDEILRVGTPRPTRRGTIGPCPRHPPPHRRPSASPAASPSASHFVSPPSPAPSTAASTP